MQAEDTVLNSAAPHRRHLSTGAVCREAAASGKSDNDSRVMLTVDNAINPLPPPPSPHPTPDAYHNPKGHEGHNPTG